MKSFETIALGLVLIIFYFYKGFTDISLDTV